MIDKGDIQSIVNHLKETKIFNKKPYRNSEKEYCIFSSDNDKIHVCFHYDKYPIEVSITLETKITYMRNCSSLNSVIDYLNDKGIKYNSENKLVKLLKDV